MGDYISREAARSEVLKWADGYSYIEIPTETATAQINAIPAADVVEVVRCRDCKHRAEDGFCTGRGWPNQLVAGNGFCEKGKRK